VGVAIYSPEFKDAAVKQVVEGGHPVADVAKRLGVSNKSLYVWLQERRGRSRLSKNAETVEGLRDEGSPALKQSSSEPRKNGTS
jgi:transposase